MSAVTPYRGLFAVRTRLGAEADLRVSRGALEASGVDVRSLFAERSVAWRPVEAVAGGKVELNLGDRAAFVPRVLLPPVRAGQWLRFALQQDGGVAVSVDLKATLKGEAKLAGLFNELTDPRGTRVR